MADRREDRVAAPVLVYPARTVPRRDAGSIAEIVSNLTQIDSVVVPPRDARAIVVPAGHVLRIACTEGPQVGDLNLFAASDLAERFYSGKTRAFHGTHLGQGDRLWSSFPHLRPMATIVHDSLGWYGTDVDGARVHDVIGTRCDPYTAQVLAGRSYDRTCHSNLTRALAAATGLAPDEAERHVHDVLNVFMCTGFTADKGLYFMKASPVRPGDHLDLLAEFDLLAVLGACPGGDCGQEHSSDLVPCHPLEMRVLRPEARILARWVEPPRAGYAGKHGI